MNHYVVFNKIWGSCESPSNHEHSILVHGSLTYLRDHSNLARNEGSGGGSINLVVPMLGSDDDAVVTDVVTLVADD